MKITERVHALKHTFKIPISPEIALDRFVYSFIIFGDEGVYLIDSGVASSGENILKYIEENRCSECCVKWLLLTHSHPDHIGSAKLIQNKTDCKIAAHEAEKDWIEDIDKQFADRPVPGFKNLVNSSVKLNKYLSDGELFEPEKDIRIKVIHTPGHSKGSISLLIENEGVLISADSILLPGDLPIYEDAEEAVESIQKLAKVNNVEWLLASWDNPVQGDKIKFRMNGSIDYLKSIHKYVKGIKDVSELEPMELCEKVVFSAGLPPAAVNPLAAAAFMSNVKKFNSKVLE